MGYETRRLVMKKVMTREGVFFVHLAISVNNTWICRSVSLTAIGPLFDPLDTSIPALRPALVEAPVAAVAVDVTMA